eukprot:TRINITY_DN16950_c0_g1_i2.p1 TRINITY_DN16950_c0_g1~~TRINITY_DN16950_c0_g1_i2.p1  ORF type:complete len:1121 (-),score=286.12 TRINITY_DN16950_c0_g1_i2:10-3372(-)
MDASKIFDDAGWEGASVEPLSLKMQVDERQTTVQPNEEAEKKALRLELALKESVRELRRVREEQGQSVRDALNEQAREWEGQKSNLLQQLKSLEQQLSESSTELDAMGVVLEDRAITIHDLEIEVDRLQGVAHELEEANKTLVQGESSRGRGEGEKADSENDSSLAFEDGQPMSTSGHRASEAISTSGVSSSQRKCRRRRSAAWCDPCGILEASGTHADPGASHRKFSNSNNSISAERCVTNAAGEGFFSDESDTSDGSVDDGREGGLLNTGPCCAMCPILRQKLTDAEEVVATLSEEQRRREEAMARMENEAAQLQETLTGTEVKYVNALREGAVMRGELALATGELESLGRIVMAWREEQHGGAGGRDSENDKQGSSSFQPQMEPGKGEAGLGASMQLASSDQSALLGRAVEQTERGCVKEGDVERMASLESSDRNGWEVVGSVDKYVPAKKGSFQTALEEEQNLSHGTVENPVSLLNDSTMAVGFAAVYQQETSERASSFSDIGTEAAVRNAQTAAHETMGTDESMEAVRKANVTISRLSADLLLARRETIDIYRELAAVEEMVGHLSNDLTETENLKAELSAAHAKVDLLSDELLRWRSDTALLYEDLQSAQGAVLSLTEELEGHPDLHVELASSHAELAESRAEIAALKVEMASLDAQLKVVQDSALESPGVAIVRSELEKCKATNTSLLEELNQWRSETSALGAALAWANERVVDLGDVEAEVDSLRAQLSQSISDVVSSNQELQTLKETLIEERAISRSTQQQQQQQVPGDTSVSVSPQKGGGAYHEVRKDACAGGEDGVKRPLQGTPRELQRHWEMAFNEKMTYSSATAVKWHARVDADSEDEGGPAREEALHEEAAKLRAEAAALNAKLAAAQAQIAQLEASLMKAETRVAEVRRSSALAGKEKLRVDKELALAHAEKGDLALQLQAAQQTVVELRCWLERGQGFSEGVGAGAGEDGDAAVLGGARGEGNGTGEDRARKSPSNGKASQHESPAELRSTTSSPQGPQRGREEPLQQRIGGPRKSLWPRRASLSSQRSISPPRLGAKPVPSPPLNFLQAAMTSSPPLSEPRGSSLPSSPNGSGVSASVRAAVSSPLGSFLGRTKRTRGEGGRE